jgi:hypothetical protein
MAQEIQEYLRNKMPVWRTEHAGVEDLKSEQGRARCDA